MWTKGLVLGLVLVLAPAAMAQSESAGYIDDAEYFGPTEGSWELTLSGAGTNDEDFENGAFSVNATLGYFVTQEWEVLVEQGVSFADLGDSSWNGSTLLGVRYNFDLDRFWPFIGARVGGVYGDDVDEEFAGGFDAGVRWYVKEETFIFGSASYVWLFDDFSDGAWQYGLGIGFNF